MKLTVKSPVWDDLREIGLWIAKDNPQAAHRFFLAVKRVFHLLKAQPELGRFTHLLANGHSVISGA